MSSESARSSVSSNCFARAATASRLALAVESLATIAGTSRDFSRVAIFWSTSLAASRSVCRLLRPRRHARGHAHSVAATNVVIRTYIANAPSSNPRASNPPCFEPPCFEPSCFTRSAQRPDDVPPRDDVGLVALEVAHEHGGALVRQHAGQRVQPVEMSANGMAGSMMASTGPFNSSGFFTISPKRWLSLTDPTSRPPARTGSCE